MSKIIDVVIQLKDNMSKPLERANASMQAHAKQWARTGKEIQRTGRNVTNAGKGLTRSLTVPIVGAGAASIKCAADFEKGMSDVMAIMGTTGSKADKQKKQLEDHAKSMSKNGFSADEVAEAYKYMGMAGWKTGQILKGTEPIMKLAAATNTDVGRTSDIVTDALTAFGAKAKDTAKLTDILAKVSTNSNTNVEMLGETFKYAAPVAGAFGYSMSETAAMSGLMANAGIKASQAGTTLRSTMTNILAPTKAAAGMMEKYGINSKEMAKLPLAKQLEKLRDTYRGLEKDEKGAFAKAIAGKNAMSGFQSIMKVSDKAFNGFTKSVKNSSGAVDKMFKTSTDNLNGQLKVLKAEAKNAAVSFGEVMLPAVKKVVTWLQKGTKWLNNLSKEEREHIVKIAAIVAALGPVLIVLGKITTIAGKVVSGFSMIAKAGGFLAALSGPGAIVVGVVAAIAAAVAWCVTHWEDMKDSVMACWDAIKPIVDAIKKAFEGLFGGITSGGKEASKKVTEFFKGALAVIAKILGWIAPIVAKIVEVIGKIVAKIAEIIKKIADKIKAFYEKHKKQIDGIANFIKGVFNTIADVFEAVIMPVFDAIGNAISGVIDAIGGILDFITGVFTLDWEQAWEGIKEIFAGIWEAISDIVTGVINGMIWGINKVIDAINWVHDAFSVTDELVDKIKGNDKIRAAAKEKGVDLDNIGGHISHIDYLAGGTKNWRGGLAHINEAGGEIVDLPTGTRVYPHDESVKRAYNDGLSSNGSTINIPKLADQIIVREDADIDKIVTKLAHELEKVSQNVGSNRIDYSFQS